jgi:peptidoglycan/LPS O-acetylase OafA/YrhL
VVASLPFAIEWISSLKTGSYTPPSSQHTIYGFIDFGFVEWLRFITLAQVFHPDPNAADLQAKFTTLNAVYWTLAIEVQFYVVVTATLYSRRWFYGVLAVVTLISIPFALLPGTYVVGIFLPYWPMFAMGIALYFVLERGIWPDSVFGRWAPLVGAAVTLAIAISFAVGAVNGHRMNSFLFAALFVIVLWFGKLCDARFMAVRSTRAWVVRLPVLILLALGAMSYSLYLLHARLQFLIMQFVRQVITANTILFDIVTLVATCLVCYCFYRCCEAPFIISQRRSGRLSSTRDARPRPAPALAGEGLVQSTTGSGAAAE